MAKITCTEHRQLAADANGKVVPVFGKPLVGQTGLAAPSASSHLTAAFGTDTNIARLCSDVALHVSSNATATTDDDYYPAGAEIVVRVAAGQQLAYLAG